MAFFRWIDAFLGILVRSFWHLILKKYLDRLRRSVIPPNQATTLGEKAVELWGTVIARGAIGMIGGWWGRIGLKDHRGTKTLSWTGTSLRFGFNLR